jgi:hypothetical protein
MNIYIPIEEPHSLRNPYISTLYDDLKALHDDVEMYYGPEKFWSSEVFKCDIIHVHWPDNLLKNDGIHQMDAERVEKRIIEIKNHGIRLFATCHNLKPHYSKDLSKEIIYDVVYKNADVIVHLGEYSYNLLKEKYSNGKHVIIPHHIYDKIYHPVSRNDGIQKLHLDENKRYILCFGAFRNHEERELVKSISKPLRKQGIEILAPSFTTVSPIRNRVHAIYVFFKKLYFKTRYPYFHIKADPVTDEELPYYYAAADVAFIQRLKILNSGNVPMGFMMGKVVVGPDTGNVGPLLKEFNNPVFSINTPNAIFVAIMRGFELASQELGDQNRSIALDKLSTDKISEQLYSVYCLNKLEGYEKINIVF